jgi:hypothetical protein
MEIQKNALHPEKDPDNGSPKRKNGNGKFYPPVRIIITFFQSHEAPIFIFRAERRFFLVSGRSFNGSPDMVHFLGVL